MKSSHVCCEKCFEKIAQQSTDCASLWLDLCKIDHESGIFSLQEVAKLKKLEAMGFISISDHFFHLSMVILGMKKEGDMTVYCCCEEKHEQEV